MKILAGLSHYTVQLITNRKITPSRTPTKIILKIIQSTIMCPLQQCMDFCLGSFGGSSDTDDLVSLTGSGSGGAAASAGRTRGRGLSIGGSKIAGGGRGGGGGGGGGAEKARRGCGGGVCD